VEKDAEEKDEDEKDEDENGELDWDMVICFLAPCLD
jgi:hypothetical protein